MYVLYVWLGLWVSLLNIAFFNHVNKTFRFSLCMWLDIVVTLCTLPQSIGNGSLTGADEASWIISGKRNYFVPFDELLHICG